MMSNLAMRLRRGLRRRVLVVTVLCLAGLVLSATFAEELILTSFESPYYYNQRDYYRDLVQLHLRNGQYDAAVQALQEGVEAARKGELLEKKPPVSRRERHPGMRLHEPPDKRLLYRRLASVQLKYGDYQKALESVEKLTELDKAAVPEKGEQLCVAIARAYLAHEDYAKTAEWIRKAAKTPGKAKISDAKAADYYAQVSRLYWQAKLDSQALQALKLSAKHYRLAGPYGSAQRTNTKYYSRLARMHAKMQRYDDAVKAYTKEAEAATSNDAKAECLYGAALSLMRMGKKPDAMKAARQAFETYTVYSGKLKAFKMMFDEYYKDDPKAAAALITETLKYARSLKDANKLAFRIIWGSSFGDKSLLSSVVRPRRPRALDAILKHLEGNSDGLQFIRAEYLSLNKATKNEARKIYETLLGKHPNELFLLSTLSHLWLDAGDFEKAMHYTRRLMAKDRRAQYRHVPLAVVRTMLKAGKREEALEFLESTKDSWVWIKHLVQQAASGLFSAGEDTRAIGLLREARKRWPDDSDILRRLLTACKKLKLHEDALGYARHMLQINPKGHTHVIPDIVNLMILTGKGEQARKFLKDTKTLWFNPWLSAKIVKVLLKGGGTQEADTIMTEMMEKWPGNSKMMRQIALIYVAQKRTKEVYAVCEKMIAHATANRDKINACRHSAEVAAKLEDWGRAVKFAEKILELPEDGDSHEHAIARIQDYTRRMQEERKAE